MVCVPRRPGKARAGHILPEAEKGEERVSGSGPAPRSLSQPDHGSAELCPWGIQMPPLCFPGGRGGEAAGQARPWERGGARTWNRGNPPRRRGAGQARSGWRALLQEVAPGCRAQS